MKRHANVSRMRQLGTGQWGRGWATWVYDDGTGWFAGKFSIHPTHAAALAHALAEVGLTEKNTEKEQNR